MILAMQWLQIACIATYALAQGLIVVYSMHRYVTLWRWWRSSHHGRTTPAPRDAELPFVSVQLPVFNERLVVDRLIDAVARLDYPRDRLEIQVLDDSTDETTGIATRAVERARARGVEARLLHRSEREGYKAGALAAGLDSARGELIAVFDADFVPGPDFLRRLVPRFDDPRVGMVQARWGHLNRDRSALTAAQAVMLDSHFLLEHVVRMERGLFFNFNGTAGVWRRSCIEDAGGWSHETLTEDLDLSYRAQLAGWRFVFAPEVESPAELPADMEAFKSQQRRWAKGSIQTARKLLPRVWASDLPLRVKLEAFVHLTSNFTYPLLLALGVLLLPLLLGTSNTPPAWLWALQASLIGLGILPVCIFLAMGQRLAGARGWRVPVNVLAALVLGIGLSVSNARAVFEGLGQHPGDWQRTPKSGDGARPSGRPPYAPRSRVAGLTETLLSGYFVLLAGWAWMQGEYRALPFIGLLVAGFMLVGLGSLQATVLRWRRG